MLRENVLWTRPLPWKCSHINEIHNGYISQLLLETWQFNPEVNTVCGTSSRHVPIHNDERKDQNNTSFFKTPQYLLRDSMNTERWLCGSLYCVGRPRLTIVHLISQETKSKHSWFENYLGHILNNVEWRCADKLCSWVTGGLKRLDRIFKDLLLSFMNVLWRFPENFTGN